VAIEVDGQTLASPAAIERAAGTTVDVVVVDPEYRRVQQACVVDEGTCAVALRPRPDAKPKRLRRRLEDKVDDVDEAAERSTP